MTRPCFHNDNNRDRLDSAVFGFFLGLRNFSFKLTSGPSFFQKSYIFEVNIGVYLNVWLKS